VHVCVCECVCECVWKQPNRVHRTKKQTRSELWCTRATTVAMCSTFSPKGTHDSKAKAANQSQPHCRPHMCLPHMPCATHIPGSLGQETAWHFPPWKRLDPAHWVPQTPRHSHSRLNLHAQAAPEMCATWHAPLPQLHGPSCGPVQWLLSPALLSRSPTQPPQCVAAARGECTWTRWFAAPPLPLPPQHCVPLHRWLFVAVTPRHPCVCPWCVVPVT